MDFGVFTIQACASLIWKERRWYKRGGPIGGRGTNMLGELAGLQDSLRVAIQFGKEGHKSRKSATPPQHVTSVNEVNSFFIGTPSKERKDESPGSASNTSSHRHVSDQSGSFMSSPNQEKIVSFC